MLHNGNIVEYMGYRHMVIHLYYVLDLDLEIIAFPVLAENGEEVLSVDRGDLTDEEIEYIQKELERRIK